MSETRPPALATWLLKHAARGNDALIGDLLEEHGRRRSVVWYWRQVRAALERSAATGGGRSVTGASSGQSFPVVR
jgi:hypothetical protein